MAPAELIRAKLQRGEKHIRDLEDEVRSFLSGVPRPYIVGTRDNMATRERTYYLVDVLDVPVGIGLIVGDALHNLRSTLDHLAWQLVLTTGSTPTGSTSFPIFDGAAKYSRGALSKLAGMRQSAIDAIAAIKPYKGGNDTLWRLHRLNNVDKHRLVISVGFTNTAHSITPSLRERLRKGFAGSYGPDVPFPYPKGVDLLIASETLIFPLKAGDEILTLPESELEDYTSFTFDVALGEPGIIEGIPVVQTLQGFAKIVGGIVDNLAPLL